VRALIAFVVIVVLTVLAIVVVQQGRRNVPVMYPWPAMGNRQSMPVRGNLPLQVNMAGMIPVIFAQSILTFPAIIAQFFVASSNVTVKKCRHLQSEPVWRPEQLVLAAFLRHGGGLLPFSTPTWCFRSRIMARTSSVWGPRCRA
jgi:preprotein translocase subunit SecY